MPHNDSRLDRLDLYHHFVDEISDSNASKIFKALTDISSKLDSVLRKEVIMGAELDALKANIASLVTTVTAQTTVIDSATAAFKGLTDQIGVLSQQLADAIAANDPVAIQAAADGIATVNQAVIDQTAKLAAAIPANTPAAKPA